MEKKFVVVMAVLALIVVAIILAIAALWYGSGIPEGKAKYVCLDGRVVYSISECVTTTTEPTTTTKFEGTESSTTTTTRTTFLGPTTTYICASNSDCGSEIVNSTPYCKDNYVKVDLLKPACINPKTVAAMCGFTPTGLSEVIQVCNDLKEFCLSGQCIPRTCVNGKRDINEEKIDCGGVCNKKCDGFSVLCNNNSDCGKMECSEEYYCLGTNPVHDCWYKQCVNNGTSGSTCVEANFTQISQVCGRSKHCKEGRRICLEGGTCSDCVMNQDETKVDCGGESCQACAEVPEYYKTIVLSGQNKFEEEYVDNYGNTYVFTLTKVLVTDRCPSGAKIRLDRGGNVIASGEIDRYSNTTLNKFTVGLLNVSTSSASIWVKEPE
jgi:hypothetical protein